MDLGDVMAIIFGGNVRLLKHQTNGGSIRQDAGSRAVHLGRESCLQTNFFNQRLPGEKKCFCFCGPCLTSTSSHKLMEGIEEIFLFSKQPCWSSSTCFTLPLTGVVTESSYIVVPFFIIIHGVEDLRSKPRCVFVMEVIYIQRRDHVMDDSEHLFCTQRKNMETP